MIYNALSNKSNFLGLVGQRAPASTSVIQPPQRAKSQALPNVHFSTSLISTISTNLSSDLSAILTKSLPQPSSFNLNRPLKGSVNLNQPVLQHINSSTFSQRLSVAMPLPPPLKLTARSSQPIILNANPIQQVSMSIINSHSANSHLNNNISLERPLQLPMLFQGVAHGLKPVTEMNQNSVKLPHILPSKQFPSPPSNQQTNRLRHPMHMGDFLTVVLPDGSTKHIIGPDTKYPLPRINQTLRQPVLPSYLKLPIHSHNQNINAQVSSLLPADVKGSSLTNHSRESFQNNVDIPHKSTTKLQEDFQTPQLQMGTFTNAIKHCSVITSNTALVNQELNANNKACGSGKAIQSESIHMRKDVLNTPSTAVNIKTAFNNEKKEKDLNISEHYAMKKGLNQRVILGEMAGFKLVRDNIKTDFVPNPNDIFFLVHHGIDCVIEELQGDAFNILKGRQRSTREKEKNSGNLADSSERTNSNSELEGEGETQKRHKHIPKKIEKEKQKGDNGAYLYNELKRPRTNSAEEDSLCKQSKNFKSENDSDNEDDLDNEDEPEMISSLERLREKYRKLKKFNPKVVLQRLSRTARKSC